MIKLPFYVFLLYFIFNFNFLHCKDNNPLIKISKGALRINYNKLNIEKYSKRFLNNDTLHENNFRNQYIFSKTDKKSKGFLINLEFDVVEIFKIIIFLFFIFVLVFGIFLFFIKKKLKTGKIRKEILSNILDFFNRNDLIKIFNEEICIICLEEFELKNKNLEFYKIIIECGHSYHLLCFAHWITKQNKCPTCRKSFPTIQEVFKC